MKINLKCIIGLPLLFVSIVKSQAQECATSYQSFNRIIESYYLEEDTPGLYWLDSLNFDCLGCFSVNQLYVVYGKSLPEGISSEIMEVVKRNKCQNVSNEQLQVFIDTQDFTNSRPQNDLLCDYIVRYEQLIRTDGDSALISQSDDITYKMLMDIVRYGAEVGCLFPILLHGSDKIPEGKISEFEKSLIELVLNGNLRPGAGAVLMDRVYYTRYGYQKYGSTTMYDKFIPIRDVGLIDSYRKNIGLYPLEVEIKIRGLKRPEGYLYAR